MKQVPLTSLVSSPRKIGGNEQEKITQSIADMIVSDHVPLSIVESKGFRNLVEIVALTTKCRAGRRSIQESSDDTTARRKH